MRKSFFSSLVLAAAHSAFARLYTITNGCPQPITLYINGESQGKLGLQTTITRTFDDSWSGQMWTDANGGGRLGTAATKAGFNGDGDYYYISLGTNRFNTGILIEPQSPINNGFCAPDMCDNKACLSVFHSVPSSFPPPSTTPPTKPLFACPGSDIGYKVAFCPSGGFPPALNDSPIPVHSGGNTDKCLDIRGVIANGTPAQISDCNGNEGQQWLLTASITRITLGFSGFCLDSGLNSSGGVQIRQCSDQATQTWNFREDFHIEASGTGQCLDATSAPSVGNQLQLLPCKDNKASQVWQI